MIVISDGPYPPMCSVLIGKLRSGWTAHGGTANGTKIQLWTCDGSAALRWLPGANSSLVNPQSGRCLDDPGRSTTEGARLQIYDCNASSAQSWRPAS